MPKCQWSATKDSDAGATPVTLPYTPQVGRLVQISSRADVEAAAKLASCPGVVVMDSTDWQSIPAENLVASFMVRSPAGGAGRGHLTHLILSHSG